MKLKSLRSTYCSFAFFSVIGTGLLTSWGAEDYSTWSFTENITLNTSATGAAITGNVQDFPVLVRLTSSNFIFSEAKGKGQDLRFSKPSGLHLNYEIERWDSAGGAAEIWVKLDTVFGNATGQSVKIHWGQSSAADSSKSGMVFGASNGFSGVWHFNASVNDATPNAYNGTDNGSTDGMALIGHGRRFNGTSNFITFGTAAGSAPSLTASMWIKTNTAAAYQQPFGKFPNDTTGKGWGFMYRVSAEDSAIHFRIGSEGAYGGWPDPVRNNKMYSPGQWDHIVGTYDFQSHTGRLYRNGALKVSAVNTDGRGVDNLSMLLTFGRFSGGTSEYFNGDADELRVSSLARSADWIKLEYENQKANQSLVTLKLSPRCQAKFSGPPATTANEGALLTLLATADCASAFSWSVLSGPAPAILDPEVQRLSVIVPRVVGDVDFVYRFTATYPDSSPHWDVRVTIKEGIPEPAFNFPAILAWTGQDSLAFIPVVTNLSAIKASRDSVLTWMWKTSGVPTDTGWLANGLLLKSASSGKLDIELCLDNGGKATCKTTSLTVSPTTALSEKTDRNPNGIQRAPAKGRNILGRRDGEPPNSSWNETSKKWIFSPD